MSADTERAATVGAIPITESAPLTVLMPVFNEALTVSAIVGRVLAQPCVRELVAVDDASTDDTWPVLQKLAAADRRVKIFRHEKNAGKGAALRTAAAQVTGSVVIVQDADLEYDPAEYARVIRPIVSGEADVVFGSRFIGSEEHRVLYFWHRLGNLLLTLLSNMFTNLTFTDMETCFKAFRANVFAQISWREDRFGFEPEITARVAAFRPRLRIYEVAVSYHGRTYEDGKKIGWRDGCRALWVIVKCNLFRR